MMTTLWRTTRRAGRAVACAAIAVAALASLEAQMRPPSIAELSRSGLRRGDTVRLVVFGTNLKGASGIVFDDPRLTARIVDYAEKGEDRLYPRAGDTRLPFPDSARRGELTIDVTAAADAPAGDHAFRIRTPYGTTAARAFEVGELPEMVENEPNDETPEAVATLPVTVNGEAGWPGDVDTFTIDARAGQQLVLSIEAVGLQSRLDSHLTLLDASGKAVAVNDDENDTSRDALIVHTIAATGRYTIRVRDTNGGGGPNSAWRLSIGELPYVTGIFPLGGRRDAAAAFVLTGANLGAAAKAQVQLTLPARRIEAGVPAQAVQDDVVAVELRPGGTALLAEPAAARGVYPEQLERTTLTARAPGQLVAAPVTINGRIDRRADGSSADVFRVSARKGQTLILSVNAARLGSPLDASIEVLDLRGRPVPRAVVRPVWETSVDLRDRGSMDPGLRLLSWSALRRGDYIFVDRELMRVRELPKGPDEDVLLMQFRGRRLSYEGTSGESHALTRPVYKVEVHPPGTTFSPNGLPLFTLDYRNDDGGPVYGKDPWLDFVAPATGDYLVRVSDSRGEASPRHAYRLTIAPPRPDFSLAVAPANPNVPSGSRVPVTIFAFRHDGFDGPIDVALTGLPAGVRATTGVILPGHSQTAVTLEAAADAAPVTAGFGVRGDARIAANTVTRVVDLTRSVPVVSITEPPSVRVASVEPSLIELAPGGSAKVRVQIERQNGFRGRVPVTVLNLPLLLTVPDIGLNGILITEQQTSREFTIVADTRATPLEQTLYLTARAEVNSGEPVDQASGPITLRVVSRPRGPDPSPAASPKP
jgi:Bacterial pre-peptidase C-terminal domain